MKPKTKKQAKRHKKTAAKKALQPRTPHIAKKDYEQISNLEQLFNKIIEHKKVNSHEIQQHSEKITPEQVINYPQKLQSIPVLEKKTKEIHEKLNAPTTQIVAQKEMEEIKEIAAEIKKHRIITDFDRVLDFVKQNKKAKLDLIAKTLAVSRKRVEECAQILEKNALIDINYPLFGDISLQIKGFEQKQKKEMIQKKMDKKTAAKKQEAKK